MTLPRAEAQNPACGACGDEVEYDDGFVCYDCQLEFDTDTLEASFLEPDATVCGADCDNYWHGAHKIKPGWGYRCGPCQLPTGHMSPHWTDCQAVEVEPA